MKKSNPWWKVIFKPLLIILNLVFFGIFLMAIILLLPGGGPASIVLLGMMPILFILAAVDFIVVLKHIKKNDPNGTLNPGKIHPITSTVLIVISLVLVYAGYAIVALFFPGT